MNDSIPPVPIRARAGRPRKCPAHPQLGKHRFDKTQTDRCRKGQWQNVCACGEMADDIVYGEPTDSQPAALAGRTLDLDDKLDVDLLVDALFDANLDWTNAIIKLCVTTDPKQARNLADEWSQDKRVIDAIERYVAQMGDSKFGFALLIHHSRKAVSNTDETGAVRATALNIQKAAYVTEKSEQHFSGPMLIQGLESGLKRMMGDSGKPEEEPEAPAELLN